MVLRSRGKRGTSPRKFSILRHTGHTRHSQPKAQQTREDSSAQQGREDKPAHNGLPTTDNKRHTGEDNGQDRAKHRPQRAGNRQQSPHGQETTRGAYAPRNTPSPPPKPTPSPNGPASPLSAPRTTWSLRSMSNTHHARKRQERNSHSRATSLIFQAARSSPSCRDFSMNASVAAFFFISSSRRNL